MPKYVRQSEKNIFKNIPMIWGAQGQKYSRYSPRGGYQIPLAKNIPKHSKKNIPKKIFQHLRGIPGIFMIGAPHINTWRGRPVTPIAWPTPKSVSHQHSQKKPYESGKCIWTVWVNCMGTYPGMGIPLFEVTLSHAVNTPRSRCSMKRTFKVRPR